jgi:hypothetical protein
MVPPVWSRDLRFVEGACMVNGVLNLVIEHAGV